MDVLKERPVAEPVDESVTCGLALPVNVAVTVLFGTPVLQFVPVFQSLDPPVQLSAAARVDEAIKAVSAANVRTAWNVFFIKLRINETPAY